MTGFAGKGPTDLPFDPDADPQAIAATLIAEHGDDAAEAIWRLGRQLTAEGRAADIPRLEDAMKIVLAMRAAGRASALH